MLRQLTIKKIANKALYTIMPNVLYKFFLEKYFQIKYKNYRHHNAFIYQNYLKGLSGIEIGGPSFIFRTIFPIYFSIKNLDCVNFSENTKWEGQIKEGKNFYKWGGKKGYQYIREASNLKGIEKKYDFLISSNCLEHIANPIRALLEWITVIKPNGYIFLCIPKKESNFDNRRPVTSFNHLLEDYYSNKDESDMTHLEEVLNLHDLSFDKNSISADSFKSICINNFFNREMHHHVFDLKLLRQIFIFLGIEIVQTDIIFSDYIILGKIPLKYKANKKLSKNFIANL